MAGKIAKTAGVVLGAALMAVATLRGALALLMDGPGSDDTVRAALAGAGGMGGLAANDRRDPPEDVDLYRIRAPMENARRLSLDHVRRICERRGRPAFCNPLATDCTSLILPRARAKPGHPRYSWKLLPGGDAPERLHDSGPRDTSLSFPERVRRAGRDPLPFGVLEAVAPEIVTWNERPLQKFVPAVQYDVRGLRNRYRKPGLGAPLIAVFAPDAAVASTTSRVMAASSGIVSVTALLRLDDPRRGLASGRLRDVPGGHARDIERSIDLAGARVPLEFEPSATLAGILDDAPIVEMQFGGGLERRSRLLDCHPAVLRAVTPCPPGTTPVVLVRRTASRLLRQPEPCSELTADPRITSRCQFRSFTCTTGSPLAVSAGLLRGSLSSVVGALDPEGKSPTLRLMVMIGHSQGGLLTGLTVVDSGSRPWSHLGTMALDELDRGQDTREALRRSPFVTPLPGTVLATGTERLRAVGAAEASALRRMPSSLDDMSPTHPFAAPCRRSWWIPA